MEKLLRLNVGCGSNDNKDPSRINCDLYPGPNVDMVFDATKPWPVKDNTVGEVLSSHVLEHLHNPHGYFDAAWHALVPGGKLTLRLPYGPSSAGFSDITHVRYWTPGTFCFLQPGYGQEVFNPQHSTWKAFFDVEGIYVRVHPKLRSLLRWPWRKLGLHSLDFLWNAYYEQIVWLKALKTKEQQEKFVKTKNARAIPLARCMYRHEWEDRELKESEPMEFLFFDHGTIGFAQVATVMQI